ncbi:hypothetical protein [Corynebacterium sp. P3-F1]|uniref:hypothetical protein n=1 Tax=Corynebacterium sp. P3-F1 TaxID=3059080 RepID=UPI003466B773
MSNAASDPTTGDTPGDAAGANSTEAGAVNEAPKREHIRVRAWHVVLLVAAVIATLLLARWQWMRFQSGTGSLQNLGYAMQWPFFGAFVVFIYRAGMRMENEKIDAENSGDTMQALYEADKAVYGDPGAMTEIDEDFLPSRPTMDIDEYNERFAPRRFGAVEDTGTHGSPERTAEQKDR